MAQGATGLGKTDGGDGLVEARLSRTSTTVLSLDRYAGKRVEVNGKIETIPASGLQVTTGAGGSDTINSAGANTAAKTANATLYYVYISSKDATSNASSIRLSTVAPTLLNGYKYLGASGNAAEWRFLGWVRTDATGLLQDSNTQRFVVNYYNRLKKRLFSCPAYNDNAAATSWTSNTASWHSANAGSGSKLEFIGNGEDAVSYHAQAYAASASGGNDIGLAVGEDVSGATNVAASVASWYTVPVANYRGSPVAGRSYLPNEAYHYLEFLTYEFASSTYYADYGRQGAAGAPDTAHTYICAEIMA